MTISTDPSIFDLFKSSIGPSSSHTAGPMHAGKAFVDELHSLGKLRHLKRIRVNLYGSLALTGRGHRTDVAIVAGLSGVEPATADSKKMEELVARLSETGELSILGQVPLGFNMSRDINFHTSECLTHHSNGMRLFAEDRNDEVFLSRTFYSVGGGAIVRDDDMEAWKLRAVDGVATPSSIKYPFSSGDELMEICSDTSLTIAQVVFANECSLRSAETVEEKLLSLWNEMKDSVERGLNGEGLLPGGLNVPRRAPALHRKLGIKNVPGSAVPLDAIDWTTVWAMAVNEENAAGGRIVTAPTNGAAGIVPAVLLYFTTFHASAGNREVLDFLLTAGAIGLLYKQNASISGAEVGCQGEVGVACSMAAAGLAAVLGGNVGQIENAAEIAMEHNLGLTCDPVGGLVQVPCIERNGVGAVKVIAAAKLALAGDGNHRVSLDTVIETMRQTGRDMQEKYKETSAGGLAANVVEC